MAADIVLGRWDAITWQQSGVTYIASWGGVFTPLSISNCVSWWDANDLSTLTLSGTNVSSWSDKSPTQNTATMATEDNQPKLISACQNGCSALYFDGVNDYFNHSYTIGNVPWTAFFVARTLRTESDPTGYNTLIYFGPPVVLSENSANRYWGAYQYANLVSYVWPTNMVVGCVVNRKYNDVDVVTEGNLLNYTIGSGWYNGGIYAHTIGAYNGGEHCKMMLCELLIYSRALTVDERQEVESYLGAKWGITITH